jgi:chromosomal replication initiator protein
LTTKNILSKLKDKTVSNDYERYLKHLIYKKSASNNEVAVFTVPNKFMANYIKTKFSTIIQETLKEISNINYKIEINVVGQKRKSKKEIELELKSNSYNESTLLNQSFTFDSFVEGKSNQMAFAASKAVAAKPGIQYNPLFIYGGTGLGKTHLLQAIGNDAVEKEKHVIYVTSEQFTNDFLFSMKTNNLENFKTKYRECDMLLIDDVQFFSGKESTQEEFFHAFNELKNANKQIVLTSDKMPSQIGGLEERLKSRFEHGLKTHIQLPELETKITIIEKKSELNGIYLKKNIIDYIASNIGNSVREIEGVLIQINANANFTGGIIDIDLVKRVLKEHIKERKENINLADIIAIVANELNVKPSDLKSSKRTKNIVDARRIAIYLSKELTHNSMPAIAQFLGMKDHSSVSKNISKTNELILENESFRLKIENLKNKIKNKGYK